MRVALGILVLLLLGGTPASTWIPTWISSWVVEPAHAQARVRSEFRQALSPYGEWRHSKRWGDVWTPRIHAGWRPYTVGRWIYTDDWGWYWVAGEPEAQWGWVVYHYGRWALDPDLGWIWVPDDTWGPSWVMWRQGTEQLGWAPMPPESLLVDYRDESDVWIFVQPQEFFATDIASVLLPVDQIDVPFQNTVWSTSRWWWTEGLRSIPASSRRSWQHRSGTRSIRIKCGRRCWRERRLFPTPSKWDSSSSGRRGSSKRRASA